MIRRVRQFLGNTAGNTALIFALGAIPVTIAVGAAVDYSRASQKQSFVQAAADAAALAAVAETRLDQTKVEEIVMKYLVANGVFDDAAAAANVSVEYKKKDGKIAVRVNSNIPTSLMRVAGIDSVSVTGYSEAVASSLALDLVLVLDSTASMSAENRMGDLKEASEKLIDELYKSASSRTDIRIGIVPFGQYVNVGTSHRNAPWIDVPPDDVGAKQCKVEKQGIYDPNCKPEVKYWNNDGVPTPWEDYSKCQTGEKDAEVCITPQRVWNGCVGSRSVALDTRIDDLSVRYPGLPEDNMNTSAYCPSPVTEMTSDRNAVKAKIGALTTSGETYIPAGLVWGWNMIDSAEPFTVPPSTSAAPMRAILLMTDGRNTKSANYPYHDGWDEAAADAKTAALCGNIKAEGIKVYTVAFKVEENSSLQLLASCASDKEYAFDAKDKTALIDSFTDIARSVASVHIAK